MTTIDPAWSIGLEVPAATRFLHVIRLTAAGAAAEAGLNAEEVDDVKIAVDELCSIMIEQSVDSEDIQIRFMAKPSSLVVEATGPGDGRLGLDELAQAILDATLDSLDIGEHAPAGGFRLTKERSER